MISNYYGPGQNIGVNLYQNRTPYENTYDLITTAPEQSISSSGFKTFTFDSQYIVGPNEIVLIDIWANGTNNATSAGCRVITSGYSSVQPLVPGLGGTQSGVDKHANPITIGSGRLNMPWFKIF